MYASLSPTVNFKNPFENCSQLNHLPNLIMMSSTKMRGIYMAGPPGFEPGISGSGGWHL